MSLGSTSRVMVLPVKVFTKICMLMSKYVGVLRRFVCAFDCRKRSGSGHAPSAEVPKCLHFILIVLLLLLGKRIEKYVVYHAYMRAPGASNSTTQNYSRIAQVRMGPRRLRTNCSFEWLTNFASHRRHH